MPLRAAEWNHLSVLLTSNMADTWYFYYIEKTRMLRNNIKMAEIINLLCDFLLLYFISNEFI